MNELNVFLVKLAPGVRPAVVAALAHAFPEAKVREAATMGAAEEAAGRLAPEGASLVVVGSSGKQRREDAGWAAVALDELGAEPVSPALLARLFRQAVAELGLRRENRRLAGDLKSVAGRVRHDLLSPVCCMQIAAAFLGQARPEAPRAGGDMVALLKQSSAEISQLLDRIGFLVNASVQPAAPADLNLALVAAHAHRELLESCRPRPLHIQWPETWPAVRGVAASVQAIWVNLLDNAVRHGGAPVTVGWEPAPEGFRFSVTDRGAGVSAETLPTLFTPFDRLHAVIVPGLGLSIVERLASLQGGRCGHERPAAGGACFYFTLPAAAGARRAQSPITPGAPPRSRLARGSGETAAG